MMLMFPWANCPATLLVAVLTCVAVADEPPAAEEVFSGPQPGEPLAPFSVRGVFGDDAGREMDFVTQSAGGPVVLVFVHDVNRQSVSLTRVLSQYAVSRAKDGLATGVVWLNDDVTAAENELKRIRHALTAEAPLGVSTDGREGPGRYGLNRNVTLTIVVAKDNVVTANFALVQPSLQADLPKILQAIVDVAGGEVPKLEDLPGMEVMMRDRAASKAEELNLRPLLAPVIRRDATDEQVDEAARRVEARAEEDEAVRREVGRIANTIINAGKLENYGTARSQEYLRKWADAYGDKAGTSDVTEPSQKSDSSDKSDDKPAGTEP
jgi:hypothetical protein